ncbi:TPA: hypothetical protein VKH48_001227 [Streptococcus pyogenes]|nr:hypothetical protein [Streptococcus pyogenes]HER3876585.1 hypothetical protein [Streptococcus pyogenes]
MAEFWSNDDRGYRIRLWVDQVGQNTEANSSQVRFRLALLNTTTTFAGYSCTGYIDYNGRRINWHGTPSMLNWNDTLWLIDETVTVNHDADGIKSFGVTASFNGSGGYSPGALTVGRANFTLSTIPRSSSVSVGDGVIGNGLVITINRQNPNYTHTLRYEWNGKSGIIATNVGTSYTWVIPSNFADDLPGAMSGKGTLYVDTYNGSIKTGTQSITFTAIVPTKIKPTFSGINLVDTNNTVKNLLKGNNFLQIMSNIQVNFIGAKGTNGATITEYRAEIVNKNQSINTNGGTLGMMNFSGSATIRACVIDSRGVQSDTKDITINVIEYFPPAFSFTALRTKSTPNIIQVIRNARVAPIALEGSQKNVMTLSFKVAPLDSNSYTEDNGSASGTFTNQAMLTNSAANLSGNYAANKSFMIVGKLADRFTSVEFSTTITTESVVMSYDKEGRVGIGKIAERGKPGSLDARGDLYGDNAIVNDIIIAGKKLRDIFYPVGTIYQSINPDNPSDFIGGTWERFGNGKVLVGVDEADNDFKTSNKEGGEKSHTLTIAELPKHSHGNTNFNTGGRPLSASTGWENTNIGLYRATDYNQENIFNQNVGGNQSHNNLQPYVTIYRWRRTA